MAGLPWVYLQTPGAVGDRRHFPGPQTPPVPLCRSLLPTKAAAVRSPGTCLGNGVGGQAHGAWTVGRSPLTLRRVPCGTQDEATDQQLNRGQGRLCSGNHAVPLHARKTSNFSYVSYFKNRMHFFSLFFQETNTNRTRSTPKNLLAHTGHVRVQTFSYNTRLGRWGQESPELTPVLSAQHSSSGVQTKP